MKSSQVLNFNAPRFSFSLLAVLTLFQYTTQQNDTSEQNVTFTPCDNKPRPCKIHSVSVDPYLPLEPDSCVMKKNTNVTWTFSFTPDFEADENNLKMIIGGSPSKMPFYFPWQEEKNVCKYTNCPFKANETREIKYQVPVLSEFPPLFVTTRWKVISGKNECCFLTKVKIEK